MGAVGAEHVMGHFGMGRTTTYHRLALLTREKMLECQVVLYGRPGMYSATAKGLRWQGLERVKRFRITPNGFEHAWQVADAAAQLHQALPDWNVVGEREIRWIELEEQELFASIQVGNIGDRKVMHRPDLALTLPGRGVVAIEVELSIKSKPLLAKICRGWARARHIDSVYYLADPRTARAVKRAVTATNAADRVRVLALEDIPTLAEEVCEQANRHLPQPYSPSATQPNRHLPAN
jgi:hypothetical protein